MTGGTEKGVCLRIRLTRAFFLLAFLLIVARAFYLQVACSDELQQRAEKQHQKVIPLTPQRGTIFDKSGEELAVSVDVESIYVNPKRAKVSTVQVKALAGALSLSPRVVRAKFDSGRGFVWVKRRVSPAEAAAVRALELPGVNFVKEHRRYYPNSDIGAQIVGFTGVDPKGLEGLELQYDSVLLGQGGYLVTARDALGRGMASGEGAVRGARIGSSLYLTIDRTLQYIVEKELQAGVEKANAKSGVAVVVEPESGKVLAMASRPGYNPNAIFRYRPADWRNRAVCDSFEPGSTFKPFLLAAALDSGTIRPDQRIYCEKGSFEVGGKVIHDHKKYEHLTIAELIKFSSNIGFAKIGKALERERFAEYIEAFGFGGKSDIDLPGEVQGIVRDPASWFEIDLAAISFGQGISVTSLQMTMAMAAIANGGYLMRPFVVEKMVGADGGLLKERKPEVVRRVLKRETAETVREMMVGPTEPGGTGTLAAIPGFRVAGKTGTAQKVDPVTGGYSADKRTASFVGMVPAEKPRLVVFVAIDEPKGQTYGGVVAAPVFQRIASQSLRHLGVSPKAGSGQQPMLPVARTDQPEMPVIKSSVSRQAGKGLRMPDFKGLSYRQALQVMERTGLNIRLTGSGRVVGQSPEAGRAIAYGGETWLKFKPLQ